MKPDTSLIGCHLSLPVAEICAGWGAETRFGEEDRLSVGYLFQWISCIPNSGHFPMLCDGFVLYQCWKESGVRTICRFLRCSLPTDQKGGALLCYQRTEDQVEHDTQQSLIQRNSFMFNFFWTKCKHINITNNIIKYRKLFVEKSQKPSKFLSSPLSTQESGLVVPGAIFIGPGTTGRC